MVEFALLYPISPWLPACTNIFVILFPNKCIYLLVHRLIIYRFIYPSARPSIHPSTHPSNHLQLFIQLSTCTQSALLTANNQFLLPSTQFAQAAVTSEQIFIRYWYDVTYNSRFWILFASTFEYGTALTHINVVRFLFYRTPLAWDFIHVLLKLLFRKHESLLLILWRLPYSQKYWLF
jgi:hypothetical protein